MSDVKLERRRQLISNLTRYEAKTKFLALSKHTVRCRTSRDEIEEKEKIELDTYKSTTEIRKSVTKTSNHITNISSRNRIRLANDPISAPKSTMERKKRKLIHSN